MPASHAPSLARPLALLLAGAVSAQGNVSARGDVWIVDDTPNPSAQFQDIQSAVDAAAEGDLVLVRAGDYSAAAIVGKSLTIQGDGAVTIHGPFVFASGPALRIAQLAVDQQVVVRGVDLEAFGFSSLDVGLSAYFCAGPVLIEDCAITNQSGIAASLVGAASVTFQRCELDAGLSRYDQVLGTFLPLPGLWLSSSGAFLYDSTVQGTEGQDAQQQVFLEFPPGAGGIGVQVFGSTLFASGCTFHGGRGGSGTATVCHPGEDGGDGLLVGQGSIARVLDTTAIAGAAGLGGTGCGLPDGAPGLPIHDPFGGVTHLPGTARSLRATSHPAEGTTVALDFAGESGDAAILVIGVDLEPGLYFDAFASVLHVSQPFALWPQGVLPASGAQQVVVPIPLLAGEPNFDAFVCQGLFVSSALEIFHGGPTSVVVLDQQF